MAVNPFNLADGQRAERKLLITVAEWTEMVEPSGGGTPVATQIREILGTRTEDSSIDYNVDIETTTDIRGNNYTDVNKSQPQQEFGTYLVLGGSKLGPKLNDIRKRNALSELSQFTIYVITAYIGDATNGYEAERHTKCTISYESLGGDTNVNFPITIYLSNMDDTTTDTAALGHAGIGTVDKLAEDFTFTLDV